ncbi:MAG TPA: histidine kinase [Longimicrobiaceae bacterium]|jgi:sensor histidine kinase YesM
MQPPSSIHPDPPPRRAALPSWRILLGVWTAFTALAMGQVYVFDSLRAHDTSVRDVLFWVLPGYLFWAGAIPAILWLDRRFPIRSGAWRAGLATHVAASLVFALLHLCLIAAVVLRADDIPADGYLDALRQLLGSKYNWSVLTYWVILSIYLAVEYFRAAADRELHSTRLQARASQLESELAHAQLLALRSQLHPHFLFNALNSVALLVDENPAAAQRMIGQLGDLLRASLSDHPRHTVPLASEIELLERYVAIERFRFEDRLRVELDVEPDTLGAQVPALLLQPLVENAVLHGIQPSLAGGTVRVAARREDAWLRLEVVDDGVGLPRGFEARIDRRVGISNARERLRTHFGDRHSFSIGPEQPSGTRVVILLPWSGADTPAEAHGEPAHGHR